MHPKKTHYKTKWFFFLFHFFIGAFICCGGEGERKQTRVAFQWGPRHWHERSCPELRVLLGETWPAVRVETTWRTRGWHQHEALWETIQRFSRCTEPPFITSAGTRWWREPRYDLAATSLRGAGDLLCLTHVWTLFWSKHNSMQTHLWLHTLAKQSGLINSVC